MPWLVDHAERRCSTTRTRAARARPRRAPCRRAARNGDRPAHFAQTQLDSAAATLRNPYPVNAALLARGELQYQRNARSATARPGRGTGRWWDPDKFPYAPAVNSAPTQGRSDGYIYGVIRVGRGLMPPYGDRMPEADMWATVAYLRRCRARARW